MESLFNSPGVLHLIKEISSEQLAYRKRTGKLHYGGVKVTGAELLRRTTEIADISLVNETK